MFGSRWSARLAFLLIAGVAAASIPALGQCGGGNAPAMQNGSTATPSIPGTQVTPLCQTGCGGGNTYCVSVTPKGAPINVVHGATQILQNIFTVTNLGNVQLSYNINCWSTGHVTCVSAYPTTTSEIQPNGHITGNVTITPGNVGDTGTVFIQAYSSGLTYDTGSFKVTTTLPLVVLSKPDSASVATRGVVHNHRPVIRAYFYPNGVQASVDSTKSIVIWTIDGQVDTITSLVRMNRGLMEWEVDSAHQIATGDSGQISVKLCDLGLDCSTQTRWAVLPNDHTPILGFTGVPLEALDRRFSAPLGPGLTADGTELSTSISTPSYFDMGSAHAFGLVYSTRQSYPRATMPVDVELPWPNGTPSKVHVTLLDTLNVVLDSQVTTTIPTCWTSTPHKCRVSLQADFSSTTFATPTRKWLRVKVQVDSGTSTHNAVDSMEVVIVDRRSTYYGSGWWPSMQAKLVTSGSDQILVQADGSAEIFRGSNYLYLSPPGDTRVLVDTNSGWVLRPRHMLLAKSVFDGIGRLTNVVDNSGNSASFIYGFLNDQLDTVVDFLGKRTVLGYVQTGSGQLLSSITLPDSRVLSVAIDTTSGMLQSDSLNSSLKGLNRGFAYQSYPGTRTMVLTKSSTAAGDTTVVTYDSTWRRKPTQATLASVDTGGGTASAVAKYTAAESRGVGVPVSLDNAYVEVKNPLLNYVHTLVNRWGQPTKVWDSIGTISQASYSPEGLVLWSQGKTDSSRVYHTYDSFLRLVNDYTYQVNGHILYLDAFVYDTAFRLSKSIGVLNDTTTISYDIYSRPTIITDPVGNAQEWTYYANGQVKQYYQSGNPYPVSFFYDTTWYNVFKGTDQSGTTVDSVIYDASGRPSYSMSVIRVQQKSGSVSQWQWRRTEHYYNALNQEDSTELLRANNCDSGCTPPSGWYTDSTHLTRAGNLYDHAGRDSIRLRDRQMSGDRTGGTLYLYDRLSRLRSRRPWGTDSSAVVDSFVYDIGGELRKAITRNGASIVSYYDARGRESARSIPTVGTQHWIYGGPNDELTKTYFDSSITPYIHQVPGSNGTVSWAYSQRGLLLADTGYAGARAEGTRYYYDSLDRDTTTTDPLSGNWVSRYDPKRGYANLLVTPMGDSVSQGLDPMGRDTLMIVASGSGHWAQKVSAAFGAVGELDSLTRTSAHGNNNFVTLKYDIKATEFFPQPPATPIVSEQHGFGASRDTLQDTIVYDGWSRDTAWYTYKNGTVKDITTYQFDRDGNVIGGALNYPNCCQQYDALTDRLLQGKSSGSTILYSYDRNGNITKANNWQYTYDALNRLVSAWFNPGTGLVEVAAYEYDALGRRIAKRVYNTFGSGTTGYTRFIYQGSQVAFETDSAWHQLRRYTWGPGTDNLLAIHDSASGNHFYASTDPLGTVRTIVRRDSVWVLSQRFDPYGLLLSRDSISAGPGFDLRYGWTGREYDAETGLYYFRARYYMPGIGRFMQEDPTGYGGGSNLYAYAGGSPLDSRDPTGTSAQQNPDPMLLCFGVRCAFSPWPVYITPSAPPSYNLANLGFDPSLLHAFDTQELQELLDDPQLGDNVYYDALEGCPTCRVANSHSVEEGIYTRKVTVYAPLTPADVRGISRDEEGYQSFDGVVDYATGKLADKVPLLGEALDATTSGLDAMAEYTPQVGDVVVVITTSGPVLGTPLNDATVDVQLTVYHTDPKTHVTTSRSYYPAPWP